MSTKHNILKNGIAALIQKIVKIAEQLLLVPLFIKYWGASYYGEWLTLTIIPSFLALSDLGFGTATANTFLLKYAAGDKRGAADIAKTGFFVISVFLCCIIIISLLIITTIYNIGAFNNSLIASKDAFWSVSLLLLSRVTNFYQPLFEAYFRAARKANMSINFQTTMSLFNIIFGAIVIFIGGKVIQYSIVLLGISLLLNPVYIFIAKKTLRMQIEGKINKNEIKKLLQIGIGYFLSPIWQAIYYQGTTFVVRISLGPIAVTIYNTIRTLVRSSSHAFAMLITAVYPDFQFELGRGNKLKAKKIFILLLTTNVLIALIAVLILVTVGPFIYAYWTEQAFHITNEVWLIFVSSIIFYSFWFTFSFVFEAMNKPFITTISGLIFSIIAILITWILSKRVGILGAAVGNLVFDILMSTIIVSKGMRTLEMTVKDTIIESKIQFRGVYNKFFDQKV